MHTFTDAAGLARHFEGLYLNAYICPSGKPTIGYGHTAGVELGQKTTEAQAEIWLVGDLADAAAAVDKLISVGLTTQQREALASFVFNLGAGRLKESTLRKELNAGDYAGAADEFDKWVFGTDPKTGEKVKLPGLVSRRAAEKALFLTGTAEQVIPSKPVKQAKQAKSEPEPTKPVQDEWENSHAR